LCLSRRLSRPTLFPYTTLFRSKDIAVNRTTSPASSRWAALVLIAVALALAGCGRKGMLDLPPNAPVQPTAAAGEADMPAAKGNLDRKSTRLNSSHDQISYAVFC